MASLVEIELETDQDVDRLHVGIAWTVAIEGFVAVVTYVAWRLWC